MPLSPAEKAYQIAHIHEDKTPTIIAAISVLSALATIAVFLRALVRWRVNAKFQAEYVSPHRLVPRSNAKSWESRDSGLTSYADSSR